MFIETARGRYGSDGSQHSGRALFLILVQRDYFKDAEGNYLSPKDRPDGYTEIRAIVRKVALHQCGHWMMGSARVKGERISISGAYGSDGNTCTVSEKVFQESIPLPKELYDAWNKGEGWNGAGSEAPMMRTWATDNLDRLYRVKTRKS